MKNKLPKIYMYTFKMYKEIESCRSCPVCEQYPDTGEIFCNILERMIQLNGNENFPENCPMDETNLPEDFGHR